MPGMDGFALAGEIKRHFGLAGATILLLASGDPSADANRCTALAVGTSLMKPIKASELLNSIMTILAPAGRKQGRASAAPVPAPPQDGRGLRILLAEDNAVNQMLAVHLLEDHGHAVVVAGNGKEALAALYPPCPPSQGGEKRVFLPPCDGGRGDSTWSSWTCRCRRWTASRPPHASARGRKRPAATCRSSP